MDRRLRILAESDDPGLEATLAVLDKLDALEKRVDAPPKRGNGNGGFYVTGRIAGLLVALVTASLIALAVTVVDVKVIKGNRFTRDDGSAMEARIKDWHSARTPPADVTRRLDVLEQLHR